MCFLTNRASQLSFIRCLFLFMKMSRSAFSGRSRFLKSVHTKPAVLNWRSDATELGGADRYFRTNGFSEVKRAMFFFHHSIGHSERPMGGTWRYFSTSAVKKFFLCLDEE